ncbi:protein hunchback [Eurosta solidaginis]|uniref:protein hunchback n=1 Tax=Eurosta solidaginis TaxID=178769 RepID=UPI0035308C51
MQNWDNMQTAATAAATYEQHNNNNNNNWYNSMFAQTEIKTEPDTALTTTQQKSSASSNDVMSHLENYLRQQQQQQQVHQQQPQTPQQMSTVDSLSAVMTPSPSNTDSLQQLVYDSGMQTQLLQQQQYQAQFQQAQQAAAHNQVTSTTPHLPLGFNPLTPPGLPTAIIPTITHFYHQQQTQQHNNARHNGQQTPSPQPPLHAISHTHAAHLAQPPTTPMDSSEKLQSALTPRNTPPMDITPPKSPTKSQIAHLAETMQQMHQQQQQQQQDKQADDAQSDTSDDMKYTAGDELDDDKMIREPIYNSHGKIKNYKCKSCGLVAITKVLFWEHARTHMKPEKILQCPKCPFVTELKHHLEYHIRKHKNLKPFQCDKCSYTCVNKSMLNSHRKSHSSVYQYRCADCDYATKYCHSFKLHLRKYDHKPGLVLDEEGLPNPSVVIDVYGTRRGPKSKSSAGGTQKRSASSNNHTSLERLHAAKSMQQCREENNGAEFKLSASQLSAALQTFSMPMQQQSHQHQHQMPVSPAKSPSSLSSSSERQTTRTLSQHQHKQQQMQQLTHATHAKLQRQSNIKNMNPTQAAAEQCAITDAKSTMSNLLPPLATILQQNPNMAFFPYWNLNLQMLAAQQQAAALAQMPTNMREKALQDLQNMHSNKDTTYNVRSPQHAAVNNEISDDDNDVHATDEDDDDVESVDRKSTDSAMDLSQGSPLKEDIEQKRSTPAAACVNLKLQELNNDTPIVSTTNGAARRKGRVLKLDATLHVKSSSAESLVSEEESAKIAPEISPIPSIVQSAATASTKEEEVAKSAVVAMDMDSAADALKDKTVVNTACSRNTSTNSTASSSGNSSNASSTSSNTSSSSTTANGPPALGTMYECKYCDIYFKDAVLYTIHMGYHSCDDVFKCNMCGEKCDGPVGLFVHMARNAHS